MNKKAKLKLGTILVIGLIVFGIWYYFNYIDSECTTSKDCIDKYDLVLPNKCNQGDIIGGGKEIVDDNYC